jgi:hypothetical protein
MKIVQTVPREKTRLYGALVKKEAAIASKGQALSTAREHRQKIQQSGSTRRIRAG